MRALGLLGLVAGCGAASMAAEPPTDTQITVAITSPAPGAELVAGTRATIAVTGTVATNTPARGALEAWVNGARVDVKNGAFTVEVAPEPGINHIKVEGGDGIAPLVSQELDVMWAAGYLAPLDGQTGFALPAALELQLGQRFFDTRLLGTTLDRSTDPIVARDVASAVELILWNIELASLITNGIHVGQGNTRIDISIPRVTPSNIVVDARIVDAPRAIDLNIDLLGVALTMTGSVTILNPPALAVQGGITADLHASARITLGTAADGSIDVNVTGITTALGALTAGFTGDDGQRLNALVAAVGNDFRALFESQLGSLIPALTDKLPPLLKQLLGAADQLLANLSFTLDPGLGSPVTLQLGGQLGGLDVAAGATSGHVTVRQDLAIQTPGAAIHHPGSLGAPQLDTTAGAPVLDTSGLHLGVRLDFLNALLHALWNAGLLEGTLTAGGLSANISARLPPLVRPTPASSPCKIDGERCDVQLQLGQLQVELPSFAQSFVIDASAGARIKIAGGTVSLAIQMTPDLRVWETSAMPGGTLTPDLVSSLISTSVWPQLFGAIGSKLTFQLPLPDLAALGLTDLAPALASAQLSLQAGPRPTVTRSELVLGADLVLATPAP
jgi:hypothetical protein